MNAELTDERIVEIFNKSKGAPGTRMLGFKVVKSDMSNGVITASFELDSRFTNPSGAVQGGFLVAALDEVMTVAAIAKSGISILAPSLEIKASYIKSVKPGAILAEGKVIRLGKSVAFLEGTLFNQKGDVAVTATATSLVRTRSREN